MKLKAWYQKKSSKFFEKSNRLLKRSENSTKRQIILTLKNMTRFLTSLTIKDMINFDVLMSFNYKERINSQRDFGEE